MLVINQLYLCLEPKLLLASPMTMLRGWINKINYFSRR
uniref:Uncharacterized protein n=2 Tax=Picea TaxID=3328 RepID=A0A101M1E5_PICGL|nr:hypothetical protein ABT39_MTgene3686 [Picea glauca]QHR90330.1 hypothetical protein Q903MT_gene4353 [Picea sitchensis]